VCEPFDVGEQRWNSNLHAFERLLREVPPGASTGVDVGCGEGETARRLRARVQSVVGIDPDDASIAEARSYGDDIDYQVATLEDADLPDASFDVVTSVAMLHHVHQREALARLASLVAPGGLLLVVGLARSRSVADFARDAVDSVAIRPHTIRKGMWETPAPKVWPPPLTYAQSRSVAMEVLDGTTFERIPFFRYGLTWRRPPE
jgi:SAM-dependent methyltransferase